MKDNVKLFLNDEVTVTAPGGVPYEAKVVEDLIENVKVKNADNVEFIVRKHWVTLTHRPPAPDVYLVPEHGLMDW